MGGFRFSRIPAIALCLLLTGCLSLHREPPRPGSTQIGSTAVTLPAQMLGNTLVIEAKWDHFGPYHFLIDTGSSVTLVTPELAARYAATNAPPPEAPEVRVRSSDGSSTVLPAAMLTRIELGSAKFTTVPVLVYDCTTLSEQFGVKIDGVLGFPFFRKTLLTLDYPRSRVILRRQTLAPLNPPGSIIPFNNADKTPLISVRLGDRMFSVLIDSGSDETLSLNPFGLAPKFAFGPTEGPTVGTLTGDRPEQIGRLSETLYIGDYAVPRPVVEITEELSAMGGGVLKYFTVTFDQDHDRVTFFRDATDPIAVPGRRSTGLSFGKTPAYWRVVGVVPGSPADAADVETGDLVTRINGEAVARWTTRRYEQLLANAESITVTFLNG
ncbi:MAG: aspartyl protease family protein, partial [Opitutaceae bacterium]